MGEETTSSPQELSELDVWRVRYFKAEQDKQAVQQESLRLQERLIALQKKLLGYEIAARENEEQAFLAHLKAPHEPTE